MSTPTDQADFTLRVQAIETLLEERGLLSSAAVDAVIERYNERTGPMNGAQVVAKAWVDPEYRNWLLQDGTNAVRDLGIDGPQMDQLVVVANSPQEHNVVVCTLCSCYPWPVLGLPPAWYKDPAYRSRIVREPRAVLAEMGLPPAADKQVRVWDSSAEVRYLVLPEQPAGTAGWSAEALAPLVNRDCMIGVALADAPQ